MHKIQTAHIKKWVSQKHNEYNWAKVEYNELRHKHKKTVAGQISLLHPSMSSQAVALNITKRLGMVVKLNFHAILCVLFKQQHKILDNLQNVFARVKLWTKTNSMLTLKSRPPFKFYLTLKISRS